MRPRCALATVLLAFLRADGATSRQIAPRQQSTIIRLDASTTSAEQTSLATSNGSPSPTRRSSLPATSHTISVNLRSTSSTEDHHVKLTASTSTPTTAAHTSSPTSSNVMQNVETLPLTPAITPALGIAGVLLIASGLALTLIGIKHKTMQIFLSAALLTSLAVSVLIVYLMSPPVSNAVQGGFFVAAFVTGVLFGAVSLLFQEVSEGLGCLLGGFCLSMWFLVLSPGGLVESTAGKAAMISVFCVVGWSFAFSRYTRNQALIVETSFGGATATIIGIDCFSRAGLIQFWLYIWNLNSNIFPLGTRNYPITRGIRVEIAGIIILFLFGMMSQFKIWKIVKARRERATMDRLRDLESRDQCDADAGRKVEARNERDLKRWEAQYDDKRQMLTNTESALGSSVISLQKKSTSIVEREIDAIEMEEISSQLSVKRTSKSAPGSTHNTDTANDEKAGEREEWNSSRQNLVNAEELQNEQSQTLATSRYSGVAEKMDTTNERGIANQAQNSHIPQVVPLPFLPPIENDKDDKSDVGSVGTQVTVGQTISERRGLRMSLSAIKKRLSSHQRFSVPLIEEDRASSIAAIADGESDDDLPPEARRSQMLPALDQAVVDGGLTPGSEDDRSRPLSYIGTATPEVPVEENDDEELVRSSPSEKEASPASLGGLGALKREPKSTYSSRRTSKSIKSLRSSWDGEPPKGDPDFEQSLAESLSGHLPEKLSKVALAYRTNEWAKHIADADQPEAEDVPEAHSPGIQVDRMFAEEAARLVDPAGLVGGVDGGVVAEPLPAARKSSKTNTNPYRKTQEATEGQARRQSSASAAVAATPIYAFQRSTSQTSLSRQSSTPSIVRPAVPSRPSQRTSSAPRLAQEALVESPSEEDFTVPVPFRNFSTPVSASASTKLLAEGNDRFKQKTSTASLTPSSVSTPPEQRKNPLVRENVSPAERQTLMMMQQQRQSQQITDTSPQPPRLTTSKSFSNLSNEARRSSQRKFSMPQLPVSPSQTSLPAQLNRTPTSYSTQATSTNKTLIYDSHQPKRGSTFDNIKQTTMLNQWRASLAEPTSGAIAAQPSQQRQGVETARQSMVAQKQWAAFNQQRSAKETSRRQSMREQAMRSGQMTAAHQDVF